MVLAVGRGAEHGASDVCSVGAVPDEKPGRAAPIVFLQAAQRSSKIMK